MTLDARINFLAFVFLLKEEEWKENLREKKIKISGLVNFKKPEKDTSHVEYLQQSQEKLQV